jgi:cell division transport system permease protein
MIQGFVGAVLSLLLLSGMLYLAVQSIPELAQLQDSTMIAILYGSILLLGILLTGFSTFFALRKYLRTQTDKLFI